VRRDRTLAADGFRLSQTALQRPAGPDREEQVRVLIGARGVIQPAHVATAFLNGSVGGGDALDPRRANGTGQSPAKP
jgi:hypothetical protein